LIEGKSGIIRIKDLEEIKNDERYPDIYMGKIHRDFDAENWKVAVKLKYYLNKNYIIYKG
jgi:hypothetical protein